MSDMSEGVLLEARPAGLVGRVVLTNDGRRGEVVGVGYSMYAGFTLLLLIEGSLETFSSHAVQIEAGR